MKNKVIIRPITSSFGTIVLLGSYEYNGKLRILTHDGYVRDYDQTDTKIPKPFEATFGERMKQITYEFETDKKLATHRDEEIKTIIDEFWSNHPLLLIGEKPHKNTKSPMFTLVDDTQRRIGVFSKWETTLKIANELNSFTNEKRRDVAYFYGLTPTGKTDDEILLLLADFNTGICITNSSDFIKNWIEDEGDRDYFINARKSIELGLVQNRPDNGIDYYYLGNVFLGSSLHDIVTYFKKEEKIYDQNILRVIGAEKKPIKETKSAAPVGEITIHEKEEIIRNADILKKKGLIPAYVNTKKEDINKLKNMVSEATKKESLQEV
jgi:hypothetical protein